MRDAVTAFASVLIAWAAIGAAPGFAQQAELDSGAITPRVDSVFAEYDRTDSPGCALGVIRDGELIYARGYGMANLDLGVAITPASVFRIGSTSKQFTLPHWVDVEAVHGCGRRAGGAERRTIARRRYPEASARDARLR
jgi:CubicO group peptidase (beta-lactamase class C family)